jgi:hypothetical protein
MSDVEFFARLSFRRLTSLEEDLKAWREQIQEDLKRNSLKKLGNSNPKSLEMTYERFANED